MSEQATAKPGGMAIYLRLLGHVRPYVRWFAVAILFLVLFALSQASIPALLKPMLDGTFVDRDPRFLVWAPVGIIALFSLRGIANFISHVAFSWVSSRVVFDLRAQLFDRYLQLPTAFYDNNATGNLISRVTFDTSRVAASATTVLTTLLRDSLTLIGLVAYILYLDWQLSLLVFGLFPIVGAMVLVLGRRLRRLHRELQQVYSQMTGILEENVKNHKVVKVFSGADYERERFWRASNGVRRLQMKTEVSSMAGVPVTEMLSALIIALIVYLGTANSEDPLSVGGFMAFLTALVLMIPSIKNLTKINGQLQMGLAAAESVFALIDELPEPDQGSLRPQRVRGDLRFEQVSFRYADTGKPALQAVSFSLPAGKTLALVGSSGGGKSTVAALIPRYYSPDSGRILIDDMDLKDIALASLRRQIAYVSQEILLFNDTLANNIAYGLAQAPSREQLIEAARAAHALEFIERMPAGFDSMVGENGVKLSGGQRQRLAIARAFLKDAPILILDEATSALDSASEQQVQQALATLQQNRTTLVIAHRLSTIERADLILVMQDGQIVESGSHQTLLQRGGVYAQMHALQRPVEGGAEES